MNRFHKLPKSILFVCDNGMDYKPTCPLEIDYQCRSGKKYDLIVFANLTFRMHIKYPEALTDAEIWYERALEINEDIFIRALTHYSNCEIRKGN